MAQSVPHKLALQYFVNGVKLVDAEINAADDTNPAYEGVVPASASNQVIRLAYAHTQVKAYVLYSDQDLTIDVNSTGSPAPAISLKAGVPQFFVTSAGMTSLFTADVTEIFATNAGMVDANLTINVLVHSA